MADDMNRLLAEWYQTNGTDKTASAPQPDPAEQEKLALAAQGQVFLKYASARGADIQALLAAGQNAAVDQIWADFHADQAKTAAAQAEFQAMKQAEFPPPKGSKDGDKKDDKDGDKKDLEEKAKKEHEEKQADLKKVAMADFQGRVMAHAMVQELNLLAANSTEVSKEAAAAVATITKNASALQGSQGQPPATTEKTAGGGMVPHSSIRSAANRAGQLLKDHAGKATAVAGMGGFGAGHALGRRGKEDSKPEESSKEGSAHPSIDLLAVEVALDKIASFAFDDARRQNASEDAAQQFAFQIAAEAAEKIAAADTLGKYNEGSVKVASAPDWQTAIDVRACELLEGAGYPIQWPS